MPGNICEVINCRRRRIDHPTLRMYRFPVQNADRLKNWMLNSGNCLTQYY